MTSAKNVANAVGGRTARACDSCITKRARWYCAADDAFLCQSCDSSVHSANSLARRHERVRLKTASYRSNSDADAGGEPSWHRGFTKKARTPRQGKQKNNPFRHQNLVPEVGFDEVNSSNEENEAQLLYRVPIYDPFVVELCSTPNSSASSAEATAASAEFTEAGAEPVVRRATALASAPKVHDYEMESLQGLLIPSDEELAEFAADVESLLGRGLENECMGMEELGLIDANKLQEEEEEEWECSLGSEKVKMEAEGEERQQVGSVEMGRESISFELNFDYDSLETCEDEVKEIKGDAELIKENEKKKILQLDYEAVIIAWSGQKSPWTTGAKPNLDLEEFLPECMGTYGTEVHQYPYGEWSGGFGCHHPAVMADGGREARVSRYREKRRTRLFSKKIRYEVRKLNAEKRPRMKGRFVKRVSSFAAAAPTTFPLLNK